MYLFRTLSTTACFSLIIVTRIIEEDEKTNAFPQIKSKKCDLNAKPTIKQLLDELQNINYSQSSIR